MVGGGGEEGKMVLGYNVHISKTLSDDNLNVCSLLKTAVYIRI